MRQYAELALACVEREYPNKIDHLLFDARDVASPRALHPAFYGCLDWHSAVHGHWLLARLRVPEAARVFDAHLTKDNLRAEAAYLAARPTFERMYGWAWLLALAVELRGTRRMRSDRARSTVQPIVDVIVSHLHAYLPKLAHPIRVGTHANTAFALALILDYARVVGDTALEALVTERATTYFAGDRDDPVHLEPAGEDFFSPALLEADLMRRVLPDFPRWFAAFLPRVDFTPVVVGDRGDPKLAHLDGLNLSRAWCLRALGFAEQAEAHIAEARVTTGDYAGEHWLATFAVCAPTSATG